MSPQSGHTEPARVRVLLDENIDDGAGANKSRARKTRSATAANAVRSDGVYERQLVRDVFEKLNVCLLAQLPSTLTVERPTSIEPRRRDEERGRQCKRWRCARSTMSGRSWLDGASDDDGVRFDGNLPLVRRRRFGRVRRKSRRAAYCHIKSVSTQRMLHA